jgi:hypothetical protein
MKNLILVFMTLISLCSYSQRDTNTVPFYFFVKDLKQDYNAVKYYIAEVLFTNNLGNGRTVETLDYIKEYIFYYDSEQDAVIATLDKNKDYKICFKKDDKLVNIYISTSSQEPKQFLSLDVDFTASKNIDVYYKKDKQYYLFTETTK